LASFGPAKKDDPCQPCGNLPRGLQFSDLTKSGRFSEFLQLPQPAAAGMPGMPL
jgi:hypothetical protein